MDIHIFDQQKDLVISYPLVKDIVKQVLAEEGKTCNEISIHFVDTATICDLHLQYFDDPSVTDCISFPMDEATDLEYCVLGDVFVCPKTAQTYAAQHQSDCYYETTLYIVHGILHLLGYDDLDEAENEMRAAEKRHMERLNSLGLWLRSTKPT